MEVVCDESSEVAGDSGSPVSGENTQTESKGHTTAVKSGWKAKREDWIKPANTSEPSEDPVINSDDSTPAPSSKDRAPRIILDEEVNGTTHNSERKKSLPPIKVPEKSAEIPVIVSRAVYNRYVLIARDEACHIL
jgi:hypothetical protein